MGAAIGRWVQVVLMCLIALPAAPTTAGADAVVVGINMTNPNTLSTAQQDTILSAMRAAGVRVIRASLPSGDAGLDFARRVYAQGMAIDWIVGFGNAYRAGAPTRPYQPDVYPGMWGGHPLSYLDPVQFRAYVAPELARLEGEGITLAAFELGNEINWAAFNPEFPLPGEGRQFGLSDLAHDPEGRQIAAGYLQYLKVLAVLKDVRDHSTLNRDTPILLAGLAAHEGPEGPLPGDARKLDLVSVNATIDFLRAHGLDQLVDAYGIHIYPSGAKPGNPAADAGRRTRLATYDLTRCRPAGSGDGKPCWITEWGFSNGDMSCPIDDTTRAALVREMMGDFKPYVEQGRLAGLFYYTWNTDGWAKTIDPLSVYRCGTLTEGGALALDAGLL